MYILGSIIRNNEYWHIIDLVNAGLDDSLYDSMMYDKVKEHMKWNMELSIGVFEEKMYRHNVDVLYITP